MEEYKSAMYRAMYVVLETLADYPDDDVETIVQHTAEAFELDDAETLMEMVTREIDARVDADSPKNSFRRQK